MAAAFRRMPREWPSARRFLWQSFLISNNASAHSCARDAFHVSATPATTEGPFRALAHLAVVYGAYDELMTRPLRWTIAVLDELFGDVSRRESCREQQSGGHVPSDRGVRLVCEGARGSCETVLSPQTHELRREYANDYRQLVTLAQTVSVWQYDRGGSDEGVLSRLAALRSSVFGGRRAASVNERAERRPDTLMGLQDLLFVRRGEEAGNQNHKHGPVRLSFWLSRWRDHPLTCVDVASMHLEQYVEFWR